jgi:hypothetical protein
LKDRRRCEEPDEVGEKAGHGCVKCAGFCGNHSLFAN